MSYNNASTTSYTVGLSEVDEQFRRWLQNLGIWPDEANRLFVILAQQSRPQRPISGQHKQMLPIVIHDAIHKVEIAARYPAFFRDLLHDASLRQEFMSIAVVTKTVIKRHEANQEPPFPDTGTI